MLTECRERVRHCLGGQKLLLAGKVEGLHRWGPGSNEIPTTRLCAMDSTPAPHNVHWPGSMGVTYKETHWPGVPGHLSVKGKSSHPSLRAYSLSTYYVPGQQPWEIGTVITFCR